MESKQKTQFDWERENDITVEEVLATDEFKHLNQEQAKEVVEFVKTLSTIFYSLYKKQYEQKTEIENNETNNYEPIKNAA